MATLLIWFCIIKPIKYKTFRNFSKTIIVKQNNKIVAQFKVNFKGARKVIFADRPFKQHFLNRIFTGKIMSIVRPQFTSPLTFIPFDKNFAAIYGTGYCASPNRIPRNGTAQITNRQNNLQISL